MLTSYSWITYSNVKAHELPGSKHAQRNTISNTTNYSKYQQLGRQGQINIKCPLFFYNPEFFYKCTRHIQKLIIIGIYFPGMSDRWIYRMDNLKENIFDTFKWNWNCYHLMIIIGVKLIISGFKVIFHFYYDYFYFSLEASLNNKRSFCNAWCVLHLCSSLVNDAIQSCVQAYSTMISKY